MDLKIAALALAASAGTALAQPTLFTDLGDRTSTQAFTQDVTTLGGADVQWFRIELPAVSAASGGWVDIWTTPTENPLAPTDLSDTEIGLYDNSGAGASTLWNNDDGGPGLFSQLSYGSTVSRGPSTYPGQSNGAARNGNGGPLAGGVYWLAVVRYNATFTQNFGVTSNATSAQTTTVLNFDISSPTDPFPPTGTGSATAATVGIGDSVVLAVTVTPGGNPVSTGITVTGDLSQIGGSATQQFFDDGSNGDATAGDNIFTYTATATAVAGAYQLPFTIADAQTRTAMGNIALTVSDPTPIVVTGGVVPSTTSATTVLVTARATAGNYPPSTGLTLTADLTSLGGSATAAMFDDGTNGDLVGGDGTYSVTANLPAEGNHPVTLSAEDDQGRVTDRVVAMMYKNAGVIQGTDGDLATEDVITVTMPTFLGSVGWMKFELGADVVNDGDAGAVSTYLDIDTEGTGVDSSVAGSLSDTEIGVYRPDGSMVANDDDDGTNFHSRLSFGDVAPVRPALVVNGSTGTTGNGRDGELVTGVYYLAIGNFNITFGAANFNATTANTTAADGEFLVNFRTNLPGSTGACSEADIGIAGGLNGQDGILDNNDFIAFINYFFAMNPIADMGIAGGLPGADGQWDNNDFIAFIGHFFDDVAACNG